MRLIGRTRCLVALVATLLVAGAAAGTTSAAAFPTPDHDPFYDRPDGLDAVAPGTVLRSRPFTVNGLGVPLPARGWQLLVRSTDSHGEPIAVVTTVMVPQVPWIGVGERPLVSYQAAIDSLGDQCQPSYTLRTGTQKELIAMAPVLARGWAIVTTDFEGPDHAYGAGRLAGQTVLDGVRGALGFGPAGLSARAPIGLWGYSGGGQATAWATQLAATYAPELEIRGVAAGGVPADIASVARALDGSLYAGLAVGAAIGIDREIPMGLDTLLNERGRRLAATIGDQCVDEFALAHPRLRFAELTVVDDPLAHPQVVAALEANALRGPAPDVPVYLYHAIVDQMIPIAGTDELAARWCAGGTPLQYERSLLGEHITYAFTGAPQAILYLEARFLGLPAPTSCPGTGPLADLAQTTAQLLGPVEGLAALIR